MILPQTYGLVLILMALCLFCWGSWANTFKLAGKYRFEAYYVDFAIGCMIVALILAFTLGNLGYDGFSFVDDLEHAGKRQWFFGFLAGILFNLGNMLLVAAVSVAGMAIAFPVSIGIAIIMGSILSLVGRPGGNILLLLAGCALIAASVAVAAIAYNILGVIRHEALARAGKAKSTRRPTTVKGVILGVVSGLLLGSYFPLVQKGMETDIGLGPYAITVVFCGGILASMLVFSVFFMNLPVEGEPVELSQYFRARPKQHFLGLLGGAIWCLGMDALLISSSAPTQAHLPPAINSLLANGFPVLAALWGLFAWKEFRDGDARVKVSGVVMLILFAGGLALVAIAPLYLRRS
jgi:glucose uptake protein